MPLAAEVASPLETSSQQVTYPAAPSILLAFRPARSASTADHAAIVTSAAPDASRSDGTMTNSHMSAVASTRKCAAGT